MARMLATGLSGAIGGRIHVSPGHSSAPEYTFVEYSGDIHTLNPRTGARTSRGGGYSELEDVAIAVNGKRAYVSERGGTIYALDFTQSDLSKASAKVIA